MGVHRRAACLVVIVALLLQCSPVQVCAVEAMAYGASCHDAALLSSDAREAHAPDAAEHHCPDPGCACDAPKSPLEPGGGKTFVTHPAASLSLPAIFVSAGSPPSAGRLTAAPAPLASPPAERVFPLLI